MTQDAVTLALTAFFTFGCITIHEARQHARAMTPALGVIVICLGLFVTLVAIAEKQPHEEVAAGSSRGGANAGTRLGVVQRRDRQSPDAVGARAARN